MAHCPGTQPSGATWAMRRSVVSLAQTARPLHGGLPTLATSGNTPAVAVLRGCAQILQDLSFRIQGSNLGPLL